MRLSPPYDLRGDKPDSAVVWQLVNQSETAFSSLLSFCPNWAEEVDWTKNDQNGPRILIFKIRFLGFFNNNANILFQNNMPHDCAQIFEKIANAILVFKKKLLTI